MASSGYGVQNQQKTRNPIFVEKLDNDVFLTPQILWNFKKSTFNSSSSMESSRLYFDKTFFSLNLLKCDQKIEVHLNIFENRINSTFVVTCGWKTPDGPVILEQTVSVTVLNGSSFSTVKIWEIAPLHLEQNQKEIFLKDSFYFVCRIFPEKEFVVDSSVLECAIGYQRSFPSIDSLSSDFKKLLTNSSEHDIVLICGEVRMPAHSAILSARSKVLGEKLKTRLKSELCITDIEPSVFEGFITYIYTGRIHYLYTVDTFCKLYRAAKTYEMRSLQAECICYLRNAISYDNFCKLLLFADEFNEINLKRYIGGYMKRQLTCCKRKGDWDDLSKKHPHLALEVMTHIAFGSTL